MRRGYEGFAVDLLYSHYGNQEIGGQNGHAYEEVHLISIGSGDVHEYYEARHGDDQRKIVIVMIHDGAAGVH